MSNTMITSLGSLIGIAPQLLVYMAGIILAVMNWQRWPQACGLVLGACVILLVSGLVQPMIHAWILTKRNNAAISVTIGTQMLVLALIFSLLRAVAMGLLIWAVFAGRPAEPMLASRFEPLPPRVQ